MKRSFYIIVGLLGFLIGVLLYLVVQPALVVLLCITFLFSVLLLLIHAMAHLYKNCDWLKYASLFLLFIIAISCGLLRSIVSEHKITPDQVDYYNNKQVELIGVISEVDIRRDKAKYKIKSETLSFRPSVTSGEISGDFSATLEMTKNEVEMTKNDHEIIKDKKIKGDVLISLNKYPQYKYGDRIKVIGELSAPGEFNGFNYGNYLSRYGVYSVVYRPRVYIIDTGNGNIFWSGMIYLQGQFMDRINRLFPEPHASFEAGLLIGARKGIPEGLMEKFNITGLTHIIAISGYNITIIIVFVMWALSFLPRKTSFIIAIVSIILFTLFVGASPAVVRASIMGILGLLALNSGRQNNIHITILFTAFFMVLWNPKIMWWDVGFQLSFMAVLGLIYAAPLFEKYSKILPEAFGAREAILMTISAQVMALPIIVYNFERLSIISPIANLLVAFALPPAMLFGFIAVLTSFIFFPLAQVFAYITWGILSYIIKVIEITSIIPYASIDLPGMRLWMMFGYYALLIIFLYFYNRSKSS